jgi:hypothetical protein
MARDSTSRGSVIAQTPVLAPYCGNCRCQHGDCCDRQSCFSNGLVSSLLQPLPCFVASDGAPACREYGVNRSMRPSLSSSSRSLMSSLGTERNRRPS